VALLIKDGAPEPFWSAVGQTAADYPDLTWGKFLFHNLLPVSLGNVIGGAVLVGAVYWFVYLRKPPARVCAASPGGAPSADAEPVGAASGSGNEEI
jgi:hypothetical protein